MIHECNLACSLQVIISQVPAAQNPPSIIGTTRCMIAAEATVIGVSGIRSDLLVRRLTIVDGNDCPFHSDGIVLNQRLNLLFGPHESILPHFPVALHSRRQFVSDPRGPHGDPEYQDGMLPLTSFSGVTVGLGWAAPRNF